ncbi:hypothetical protein F8S12_04620 [Nostoc sp. WHI]|nr:hypothetical protein [Nostoc sp. WHI]
MRCLRKRFRNLKSTHRPNPLPPFPTREGGIKASPRSGERFGEGSCINLRRCLLGAYSRRINIQHRLVYEVIESEQLVKIIRMWTHYE